MPNITTFMSAYALKFNLQQADNMTAFKEVRDMLKDKSTRVVVAKEMKKGAELIKLDGARREMTALINNAVAFYALPDRTVNLQSINYDNLKRVIRLSKYVTANHDGDMSKLSGLGNIWTSNMSGWRYNNLLEEKCKALTEAIKVVAVSPTEEQVLKYADTLSIASKKALLARLMADLHVEEEVAA